MRFEAPAGRLDPGEGPDDVAGDQGQLGAPPLLPSRGQRGSPLPDGGVVPRLLLLAARSGRGRTASRLPALPAGGGEVQARVDRVHRRALAELLGATGAPAHPRRGRRLEGRRGLSRSRLYVVLR